MLGRVWHGREIKGYTAVTTRCPGFTDIWVRQGFFLVFSYLCCIFVTVRPRWLTCSSALVFVTVAPSFLAFVEA